MQPQPYYNPQQPGYGVPYQQSPHPQQQQQPIVQYVDQYGRPIAVNNPQPLVYQQPYQQPYQHPYQPQYVQPQGQYHQPQYIQPQSPVQAPVFHHQVSVPVNNEPPPPA